MEIFPQPLNFRPGQIVDLSDDSASRCGEGLMTSLQETWSHLRREQPEEVEENELARAIALSLQDRAVVSAKAAAPAVALVADPAAVLGVSPTASEAEVRRAYRQLALAAHPDKGGAEDEFARLQQAYRQLVSPKATTIAPVLSLQNSRETDLREHRSLVDDMFARDGADRQAQVSAQDAALACLGLEFEDVGARNKNERGEYMYNQCFYLSLARSYLSAGDPEMRDRQMIEQTALHLKRVIEAAVLRAHPEWAGNQVGDDVQAFSDFLFFVMGTNVLLMDLAVACFDTSSGGAEIYVGTSFPTDPELQRSNLLTIRHVPGPPGHYQALVVRGRRPPHYSELLAALDATGVRYVVSDGKR